MSDHNTEIDELLDEIIFSGTNPDKLTELMPGITKNELIDELVLHQTAASTVQRYELISQVAAVHHQFLNDRQFNNASAGNTRVTRLRSSRIKMMWAAAATIIVIPALIFMYVLISNSPEQLFRNEYVAYHFNVDRNPQASASQPVVTSYQQGKYDEAINLYKSNSNNSVNAQMAAAFSYMQTKNYQPAAAIFEEVMSSNKANGTRTYEDDAEYYLALCYLNLNQVDKSYRLFNKIYNDSEHTYNGRIDKWFMTRLKWLK